MAFEIERKFMVVSDAYKQAAVRITFIKQGYLSSVPERSVRVRIKGEKAYLTIKGISNENGTTRFEWEKEISTSEAHELFKICEPGVIEKNRFEVNCGTHIIEVDEFMGENQGLVMAEIELRYENEAFEKPLWLGMELTGDKRYYNSYLASNPFIHWNKN